MKGSYWYQRRKVKLIQAFKDNGQNIKSHQNQISFNAQIVPVKNTTVLQTPVIKILKEKCPVSACVLSSTRAEAESADLVLFKDHFTMPYFKRPLNQIWMLYLLGILTSFKD